MVFIILSHKWKWKIHDYNQLNADFCQDSHRKNYHTWCRTHRCHWNCQRKNSRQIGNSPRSAKINLRWKTAWRRKKLVWLQYRQRIHSSPCSQTERWKMIRFHYLLIYFNKTIYVGFYFSYGVNISLYIWLLILMDYVWKCLIMIVIILYNIRIISGWVNGSKEAKQYCPVAWKQSLLLWFRIREYLGLACNFSAVGTITAAESVVYPATLILFL